LVGNNQLISLSMATDDVLYYFVPKEILSQIFCQYLLLEDISHFDVAICNNKKRPRYLEVIGSVACIFLGDIKRRFSCEGISWLSNRHIRIRNLWVRDVVNDDTAIEIGAHLLWLDINRKGLSDIDMITTVEGCRNIEILNISDCHSITDIGVLRIAECCPKLKELYMRDCQKITDTSIIKLAECCHGIESLDIEKCINITDTSVINLQNNVLIIKNYTCQAAIISMTQA
jgi:hypothetical protein